MSMVPVKQVMPKSTFVKFARFTFCEKVDKRYTIEVTTIDGKPFINMAAYFIGHDNDWKQDRKKNYFMTPDVFEILAVKFAQVATRVMEQARMGVHIFYSDVYKVVIS